MTVTSGSDTYKLYSGDGTTHVFAYTFRVFQNTELLVLIRNNTTGATYIASDAARSGSYDPDTHVGGEGLNTAYILSGVDDPNGGNVTFKYDTNNPSDENYSTTDYRPQTGESVIIIRVPAVSQETNYVPGGAFPAESHEDALDKLTFHVQRIEDQLNKTIQRPEADTGAVGSSIDSSLSVLPDNEDMKGKYLSFNATTGAPEAGATATDVVLSSSAQTLTNKSINADNNSISNLEVDNFKDSAVVTESEGIATFDNDTTLPTSAAVKNYVDSQVSAVPVSDILSITAGTGLTGGGSAGDVELSIDSTVVTLSGTGTLTNKTIDASQLTGTIDDARIPAATTTSPGLLSAADKTKLNGIDANATDDQTAAEIRTLVDSASDSNVFTDADKVRLEGIEAGADVTDTANVVAALTAGTNVTIAGDGTISATDTDTQYSEATTSTSGLMSAADKTKLDGVETGATADQTAAEILTEIKTVDGAASGLDADLLDGQEGSYYTGYTDSAVANLVDSAPATLDTLNELAAALGDDANFSTTVTNSIATKLPLAGGTMTGDLIMSGADIEVDGGSELRLTSSAGNPVIRIGGGGPNGIRFVDGSNFDVNTNAVDIKYRTSSNDLLVETAGNNKIAEFGGDDGHAALYFLNSKKLETTSEGISVLSTADNGPVINLVSDDSADAANFGTEGAIKFYADNNADESTLYAQISNVTADVTDGTEDGWLYFSALDNGTLKDAFAAARGNLYLLDDAGEIQFRSWGGTSHHVTLTPSTPTADRTITLPDATGTVPVFTTAPTSAITDGTNGQVLTTNGSGGLSFTTVSGGGGISNVVEDTTPQLGGDLDTNGNNINFADNAKATFGNDGDLEILHNSFASQIRDVGNGGLVLQTTNGAFIQLSTDFDIMAKFYRNGAAELYYDNSKKLETVTGGVDITGDITVSGTVDGRDLSADGTKLDGIEASADVTDTANVTAAGALMDSEVTNLAQVKAFDSSDYATAAQGTTADAALPKSGGTMTGNITFSGSQTFDGRDLSVDGAKLDGIESGATADQTAAEIRTLVESASDSNVFTDADHTKLNGIEASADVTDTANVTAAGALMDSEVTNLADVKSFDPADYATAAQGTTADAAMPKAGGTFTGDVTFTGDSYNVVWDKSDNALEFADNAKVTFGADGDLEIFHSGTASVIRDGGTGPLRVRANATHIQDPAATETMASFTQNGAVELFYDNVKKLETTSDGVTITSTDDGAANAPILTLYRDSASPADFDNLGNILFVGKNDAGQDVTFAELESINSDVSDGTEDGLVRVKIMISGTLTNQFDFANYANVSYKNLLLTAGRQLVFEGSTDDGNETFLTVTDPTADRTIALPDADGTVALQNQTINAQTGTTYTTVLSDAAQLVTLNNASAITLTIPPNSSVAYPTGTRIDFIQIGAGQVTVAGGTGVTVNSTPTLKFRAQHSAASCIKIATDTWQLVGDLAES